MEFGNSGHYWRAAKHRDAICWELVWNFKFSPPQYCSFFWGSAYGVQYTFLWNPSWERGLIRGESGVGKLSLQSAASLLQIATVQPKVVYFTWHMQAGRMGKKTLSKLYKSFTLQLEVHKLVGLCMTILPVNVHNVLQFWFCFVLCNWLLRKIKLLKAIQ